MNQFRIWDKETETWMDEEFYYINSRGYILHNLLHVPGDNLVVQKNTGLIDLYQNDIYDGDIVALYYHHSNITANLYTINYRMGRWMLGDEKDLSRFWFDSTKFGEVCRVIVVGNIFQPSI